MPRGAIVHLRTPWLGLKKKKNTTDLNAGPFHHPSSGLDPADQIQQRRVCPEGERSMKEERDEERGMMFW